MILHESHISNLHNISRQKSEVLSSLNAVNKYATTDTRASLAISQNIQKSLCEMHMI